ncbi:unnamed protein product [Lactuca virosa]|uniref:Uncharacterized protein n=1 Tax=Lactuca virosa TaxID=75947 RepID=A0AAU9LZH0_9ASTR|nr:unnamed protein product [Lactuca virosa]
MLSTDFSSFFTRPIDASDIFFGHLYRLSLHLCFYLLAMHLRHHSILRPSTSSPRVSKALATTFHSSINFLYEAIAVVDSFNQMNDKLSENQFFCPSLPEGYRWGMD